MNQLSGMTLTTRHRAAFHHSELMPAQLLAHRPTAAQLSRVKKMRQFGAFGVWRAGRGSGGRSAASSRPRARVACVCCGVVAA
jgi:hypothetical protein